MDNLFDKEYVPVAGECDARQELPLTSLAMNLIEVASMHANALGFGHDDMAPVNLGWVLSRLSVEMRRFPTVNRAYRVTTWIESWTRHYSERCFEIIDIASGETLGYARTIWMVIDTVRHCGASTDTLAFDPSYICDRPCPIAHMPRLPRIRHDEPGVTTRRYTYTYTDIDLYRHVNTVKHIRTIIDSYDLGRMDRERIVRADFAFASEGHYGETVTIIHRDDEIFRVEGDDGRTVLTASVTLAGE